MGLTSDRSTRKRPEGPAALSPSGLSCFRKDFPICSAPLVSAQKKSDAGNHQVISPAALCLQKNKRVLSGVNCGVNAISAPFECPISPVFIDFFIFYFTYFLIIQDSYGKVNRNVAS